MTQDTREALITASFELAADRCDDLTPLVYSRLFSRHPEMAAEFRQEAGNFVKGEMLAQAINVILDFVGARTYSARMIQCEVVNHAAMGISPDVFGIFFSVVRDALRDLLGADWTPALERCWSEVLTELDFFVRHPEQTAVVWRAVDGGSSTISMTESGRRGVANPSRD